MKLLKLIVWFFTVIIGAYILSGVHVGGKTVKQLVDEQIDKSPTASEYRAKLIHFLGGNAITRPFVDQTDKNTGNEPKVEDEISKKDAEELLKIIKNNNH